MTKSRIWLALCLAVIALGSVAVAQPTNPATSLLNSPVKVDFQGFGPTLVRSAPWAGTANFGICEDLSDNTLWGTDLFTAQIHQYDKALNYLSTIPGFTGTETGIAYDHVNDTFWVIRVALKQIAEIDKTGTPTGNVVSTLATGGTVPGPLTIDPSSGTVTWWLEDIALDAMFQLDAAGTVLRTHPNPQGTGVYGNGLSYDAFDAGPQPQNLHVTSGTSAEARVSRIWEGQPNAAVPRPYVSILEIGSFDGFINGIQNTTDATATPSEVWYIHANSANTIIEVNDVPIPAIVQCAPGAVNAGTPVIGAVFSDDMESGEGPNWTHGAVLGTDDWAVTTSPYAHSGTQAWTCIDDLTYTDKHLDLTVDIASPATELTFWHTWYFEATAYDGGLLEISTDGGTSFTQLDAEIVEGGYTNTISTCCANPIAGLPAWTAGSFGNMKRVKVDLSGFDGTTGAVLRWRFGSDSCCGPGANGGWHIDDVDLAEPSTCDAVNTPVLFINRVTATNVYFDDMESGAGAEWSSGAAVGTDDWAIGSTPFAHSPTNAWQCIDDTTFTDKYLDLTVDINAPATDLSFWHTFYFESGSYDGGILQISVDGGATFAQLNAEIYQGGYTGTINCAFGNPLGCVPAWVQGGAFGAMTEVRADLSAFDGTTGAIIRWRVGTDSCCGPGVNGGWKIDDVALQTVPNSGTGDDDYTVDLSQSASFKMEIDEAPGMIGDAATSKACVYAWVGAPGVGDIVDVPKELGPMCFGPYIIATKNPKKIWNGIGVTNKLGVTNMTNPIIPDGGSYTLLNKPNGIGKVATATFQGLIQDVCSQGKKPYSVTNGILLNLLP